MVEMASVDAKLCAMLGLIGVVFGPLGGVLLVIDEVVASGLGVPLLVPSLPGCLVTLRMLIGSLVVVFVECRHRLRAPP